MSKKPAQEAADQLYQAALEKHGARDPREFYRDRLRELKGTDPESYEQAVRYYQDTLLPEVVGGASDPVQAWLRYGRALATLVTPGEAVEVDRTGRRLPVDGDISHEHLVLHIPEGRSGRALLVGLPRELSPAQHATYQLLVLGRLKQRPNASGTN